MPAVRAGDGFADGVAVRPERAPRRTSGGLDTNLGAGDLRGQLGKAVSQFQAVGDQYNPDQIRLLPNLKLAPRPLPERLA